MEGQWLTGGVNTRPTCDTLPPPLFTVISLLPSSARLAKFLATLIYPHWQFPLKGLLMRIQGAPVCRFLVLQGKNWARFWQLGQRWRWQAHLMANSATPMSALSLVESRGEAAFWLVELGSHQRGFVLLASAHWEIDYGPGSGRVVFHLNFKPMDISKQFLKRNMYYCVIVIDKLQRK